MLWTQVGVEHLLTESPHYNIWIINVSHSVHVWLTQRIIRAEKKNLLILFIVSDLLQFMASSWPAWRNDVIAHGCTNRALPSLHLLIGKRRRVAQRHVQDPLTSAGTAALKGRYDAKRGLTSGSPSGWTLWHFLLFSDASKCLKRFLWGQDSTNGMARMVKL